MDWHIKSGVLYHDLSDCDLARRSGRCGFQPHGIQSNRTVSACPDSRDPDLSGLETAPTKLCYGTRNVPTSL